MGALRISMNMVVDFLPEDYGAEIHGPVEERRNTIDMVMLAFERTMRYEDGLFVLTAEELEDFLQPGQKSQRLLVIGQPKMLLPDDMVYITVRDGLDVIDVFCAIRAEVLRVRQWAEDMYNALLERRDIQELCTLAQEGVKNEIVVQSMDYLILAHTERAEDYDDPPWDYDKKLSRYRRHRDSLEVVFTDPAYRKLAASRELNLYENHYLGIRVLTKNVYLNEMHIANVIMIESQCAFTPGNQELSRFAAGILEYALQSYVLVGEFRPDAGLRQLAEMMLEGETIERQHVQQTLDEFGWKINDRYLCCVLQPVSGSAMKVETEYFELQLRSILGFGNNLVLFYQNRIIVIYNFSFVKEDEYLFLSRLIPFIRDNLLRMGQSDAFTDFSELHYAYYKAVTAVEMGKTLEPARWDCKFEKYLLPYMWNACTRDLPAEHLYPAGLKKLLAYDREKQTAYCHTLYRYLPNRNNVVRTAEELRISRSAMIKRLDRIRTLTGSDFQEPLVCLHYMWVMAMGAYENREEAD